MNAHEARIPLRYVIGIRPATTPDGTMIIPSDYAIYNAPRPLYGTMMPIGIASHHALVWSLPGGPTGMLFAAVGPDDLDRETWITENARLDAVQVIYCTEHQVIDTARRYFTARYPDKMKELDFAVAKTRTWFLQRSLQLLNDGTIAIGD